MKLFELMSCSNIGFANNFEIPKDILKTTNPESTLALQDTQRLIPELVSQAPIDKYSHIKSKVKASLSPLVNSNRKLNKK